MRNQDTTQVDELTQFFDDDESKGTELPPLPWNRQCPTIDIKQDKYINTLLETGSPTEAKKVSGYTSTGIFKSPYAREKLEIRLRELKDKLKITPDRVLQEYARIAFFDIRNILDDDGKLLPLNEMDDDSVAAISGVDMQTLGDADGVIRAEVHKYKIADKLRALEILAKRLKLFDDTTNIKIEGELEMKMGKNEKARRIAFFLAEVLRKQNSHDEVNAAEAEVAI